MNQNMNSSDNVRADMFGWGWSPTGWPRGQKHNSCGKNSSSLVQSESCKGERWSRMPLLQDSGSNTSQITGSRAHWPQGHIPGILPSDSDVLVSLRRTDGLLKTSAVEGGVRDQAGDLLISLFFPTSRLAVVWTLVNHSVWVSVKLIHLKTARSLFRLWC